MSLSDGKYLPIGYVAAVHDQIPDLDAASH